MAGLFHAQMRLRRPAGLTHSDHKGRGQSIVQASQNGTHAIWINVVEEVKRQTSAVTLQRFDHQQGAQTATADTDPENVCERLPPGSFDGAADHIPTELLDLIDFCGDVVSDRFTGRQLRGPQPVVTHLTLLIRVGNGPSFKLGHGREGLVESRLQLLEMGWVDVHAADVQPDAEIFVIPEEVTEALPLNLSVTGAEIREAHRALMVHSD